MPHIHTDPGQHDLTASAYVVRLDTAEPSLVVHMHRKLGRYMQFGGHVELDGNPWQAVTHELAEESGYSLSELKLLQPKLRLTRAKGSIVHPMPVSLNTHKFDEQHNHIDISYVFTADGPPVGKVASGESEDIRLVTARQLRDLPEESVFEDVRDTGLFILENILGEWQPVATDQLDI